MEYSSGAFTDRMRSGTDGWFYNESIKYREVIAINQDIAGIQGSRVYADNNKEIEVWSKPLKDGSIAVGLFNLSDNKQDISIFWDQLNIQGKQKVRNLWEQKDKGVYINKYQSDVPSHGVLFIKIEPVK